MLGLESLNRALDGRQISRQEAAEIYNADPGELYYTAESLRQRYKGSLVTFSKKAFFNVINLCSDSCSYCTYKAGPADSKLSLMDMQQITELIRLAKNSHCIEALFVTGERPEEQYSEARKWLHGMGFASTAEYLVHASEAALEAGLFPHTNAGNLHVEEIRELQKTNVSIGMMLENISPRLAEKGMPHHLAASKRPEARTEALRNAGRLKIPVTTGALIGIGETIPEIIDSLFAIKEMHETYGNIQEIILQNFQPNSDTAMRDAPPADGDYFKRIVALARIIMPKVNLQIPPNLSPDSYHEFLSAGINDWGGISPLTPDHVNPGFAWPEISRVDRNSADAGYDLGCRFPIYPEFFCMTSGRLREKISEIEDDGLVREDYWR
ncbi:MAG: 7,8-didemethyl-8-hydroxy-5-deazariboflavin synthase subunit CofG [Nitrosopumilus sp. B06]|nr:MAG: 7,8-didemethyl-8-hydroxy-5-deazariboflavin synthase subunit CofG [Nitrosopumilus sp. B06]